MSCEELASTHIIASGTSKNRIQFFEFPDSVLLRFPLFLLIVLRKHETVTVMGRTE